ncbi:MAG TPA: glycosyl hydrolase family 18 protein [Candidatus Angelobacter sp.]|nr:glycosyl hydrolase family 18 protein [Candidatus Angelobacter sp.]
MSFPRVRPLAVTLAFVFALAGVTPALATDPDGPSDAPPLGPSIHHEMLLEHEGDAPDFTPGGTPQALSAPLQVGGTMSLDGASGGTAALANGLSHEVLGYLPSWVLTASDLANLRYDLVTTIAYFGVEARRNGTLATDTNGAKGWASSAMTDVISKAHARGVRVVMTLTMFAWDYEYEAMEELLRSAPKRAALIDAVAATLKARNADGVNVDFEPVPDHLKAEFTTFVHELKAGLKAKGAGSYLTVATLAGAASWATGYDLPGLVAAGGADAVMVMAYDFNYPGSARAGGVAPWVSPYSFDNRTAIEAHVRTIPGSKIIWGVPYYGRAWTTTTSDVNSRTCFSAGGCTAASWAPRYVDAVEQIATHGRQWDGTGQVPWYRFRSSTYNTWVQGYYDDPASLKQKYGVVKANGLRGVGIWHLLMDGTRRDLWDTIYTQFGPLPFTDIRNSKFALDIVWLAETGITSGCTETAFCPSGAVTRGQMASFLARFLKLPPTATDYFDDDKGNKHESNINRLAEAKITVGCGERRFCPDGLVARDQMASFLARALKLPPAPADYFTDDAGNRHEDAINRLAASKITSGCGEKRYCPSGLVVREQMAAFLHRASRH